MARRSDTVSGRPCFWRGVTTIRGQIFAAFALVTVVVAIVGLYAAYGMREAGHMVVRTFDMPLMAISHARLAKSQFEELRYRTLKRQVSGLDPAADAAADAAIGELLDELKQDLAIAAQRSISPEGKSSAARIAEMITAWRAVYAHGRDADAGELARLDQRIEREFNVLVNIAAGDAFRWRQSAIATAEFNERLQIAGVCAALLLTFGITFLLARQILRPIKAAAGAAARIADGELETPIPNVGASETRALLAAMTVMQDNLRAMMAREVAEKRSAQRRLADAIETVREGIVFIGSDGIVLMANSQALRLFPQSAAYLAPGRKFEEFVEHARADVAAKGEGADSFKAASGEVKLADGRWISISYNPAGDGGAVVIWNDITLLKDREAHLISAKEEAEAADKAKTNFLANMSHELRTPLNAVIGFSEMIANEVLGPVGKPQYRTYAADIVGSGRHLLAIINDILDIAKSEAGTLHIDPQPLSVATLFEECAAIVRIGMEKAKLDFAVAPPGQGVSIYADPVKTRQILLNLLSNAMKFTPSGGTVALAADEHGAEAVELVVTDTGIGMRAEDIPVALAPFGQIESGLARKYEGTGLGLPLTKILTELHGGELLIDSRPGSGTRVRVRLPRRAAMQAALQPRNAVRAAA
jgi:signal transduction histidine kinase